MGSKEYYELLSGMGKDFSPWRFKVLETAILKYINNPEESVPEKVLTCLRIAREKHINTSKLDELLLEGYESHHELKEAKKGLIIYENNAYR